MRVEDVGAMIPTTQVWDVSEIYSMDVTSPEFKELLVRLYQNIGSISQVINNKDTGVYNTSEFLCGQIFFPNLNPIAGQPNDFRQVYRKVINFGALPNATDKGVDHGISFGPGFTITRLYGAATDPTHRLYFPLPYVANSKDEPIALWATATKVYTDTYATDRSAFTTTYIVIEYMKQ
jgi:hypothetical protein